jgi:hypothetical protein
MIPTKNNFLKTISAGTIISTIIIIILGMIQISFAQEPLKSWYEKPADWNEIILMIENGGGAWKFKCLLLTLDNKALFPGKNTRRPSIWD